MHTFHFYRAWKWLITYDGLANEIFGLVLSNDPGFFVLKANWIKIIKSTLYCLPPFPSKTISTLSTHLLHVPPPPSRGDSHMKR